MTVTSITDIDQYLNIVDAIWNTNVPNYKGDGIPWDNIFSLPNSDDFLIDKISLALNLS